MPRFKTFLIFSFAVSAVVSCRTARDDSFAEIANNKACHVCHLNYADEPLAVSHAKKGVGCVDCHGDSEKHLGDEAAVIAPDQIYDTGNNKACCMECHEKADLNRKCLSALDYKEGGKDCTDCHGSHRLNKRQRKWDPKTRKLLWSDDSSEDMMGM